MPDPSKIKQMLSKGSPEASASYDSNFKSRIPELMGKGKFYAPNIFGSEAREIETKYDLSNQDYLTGYENPMTQEIDELRAQRQSWGRKLTNGLARAGVKAVTEVAKMPGVVVGSLLAPGQNDGYKLDMAFNNAWIRSIDNFSEEFKESALPVYAKQAIKDGNIWDKMTSMDFLAKEGADGVGFLASMLAPGAAIKALALGKGITKAIGRAAQGYKAGSKIDDLAQMVAKGKLTPQRIDAVTQTVANTMFEAAAEARSAGDNYEARMEAKLKSGEISLSDYREGKSNAMRNTFMANAAILMGPNAIMTKMVYGNKISKRAQARLQKEGVFSGATKTVKEGAEEIADEAVKGKQGILKALASWAAPKGKALASGAAREGFFEEGMQSTVENYFTDKAVDGELLGITDLDDIISDMPEAYLKMIGTPEGQEAIALGALLGGGMQVIMTRGEAKRAKAAEDQLISNVIALDAFYKLMGTDVHNLETGKIDPAKVADKLRGIAGMQLMSDAFDKAVKNGDQNTIDALQAWSTGETTKEFITKGENGIQALEEYLRASEPVAEMAGLQGKSRESLIQTTLNRARKLQKDYELFEELGESFMAMQNENATAEDLDVFYGAMASQYMSKRNMLYFYQDKRDKAASTLQSAKESLKVSSQVTEEEIAQTQETSEIVQQAATKLQTLDERIADQKAELNEFWKGTNIKESFDNFIDNRTAVRKQAQEQEAKAVETVATKIKGATKAEELDEIEKALEQIPNPGRKGLEVQLKKKRKELKKVQQEKGATQTKDQEVNTKETAETNDKEEGELEDVFSYLDQFNVNEPMTLSTAQSKKYGVDGAQLLVASKSDTEIKLLDPTAPGGRLITVPASTKPTASPKNYTPLSNYSTEGSDHHNVLTPTDNENKSNEKDSVMGTGAKVISTNKKTGEPFPFVDPLYIAYEKEPTPKKNKTVGFAINENPGDNLQVNKALKAFKANDFSDMDLLIDYLPLNTVFTPNVQAPIETRPAKAGESQDIFNKASRVMRKSIVEALAAGTDIADISTNIEGQYEGRLKVDNKKPDGSHPKNNIMDLHHLKNLNEKDKIEEIRKNIGVVNATGAIVLLDGTTVDIGKPKAKGEIFLMIPKANGEKFPLKLNIAFLKDNHADILYSIYEARFNNKEITKTTVLNEMPNPELVAKIKKELATELKLIGKGNDVTIGDIVNFLAWDGSKAVNRKMGLSGTKKKGESAFIFGNAKTRGAKVIQGKDDIEGSKDQFLDWATTQKPYNITIKRHKGSTSKANIFNNAEYLKYLLNNRLLNTNAVVNEPTFQGYTNIYLNSRGVQIKGANPAPSVQTKEETPSDEKMEEKITKEVQKRFAAWKKENPGAKPMDYIAVTERLNAEVRQSMEKEPGPLPKPKPKEAGYTYENPFIQEVAGADEMLEYSYWQRPDGKYMKRTPTQLSFGEMMEGSTNEITEEEYNKAIGKQKPNPNQAASINKDAKAVKEAMQEVAKNKDFIILDEDGKGYTNKKTGKKYQRVTKFIEPNREVGESGLVKASFAIGNKIDVLVRDFFAGELKPLKEYDVAKEALLEKYIEHLTAIKEAMDARGEVVMANDVVVYNDAIGVAGTVDLITYDRKGDVRIYDMKTMRGNQFVDVHKSGDNIGKPKYNNPYKIGQLSNKEKHQMQLSLYRILLNNTHGIKARTIATMPIQIAYKEGDTTTSVLIPHRGQKLTPLNKVRTAVLNDKASLKKLEKTEENIRKSQEKVVSSQEITMKGKIETLRTYVLDNKLVLGGKPLKMLFKGTDQEKLDRLTAIVEKDGKNVQEIIDSKKC